MLSFLEWEIGTKIMKLESGKLGRRKDSHNQSWLMVSRWQPTAPALQHEAQWVLRDTETMGF